MEYLKTSPEQHLGSLELSRYRDLLNKKYETIMRYSIGSYGILKNLIIDPSYNNLKLVAGTSTWKYTLKAGFALDKNMNLINVPYDIVDAFDFEAASNGNVAGTPYVYIEYQEPETVYDEVGTVSVDASGVMTGTGTKFTECLRGEPYHPMKIQFTNSLNNFQEYEILSVTSDTVAALKLVGGISVESGLKYKCIGTFAPGVPIPKESKGIFNLNEVNNFKLGYINPRTNFDISQFERPYVQFLLAFAAPTNPIDLRDVNILEFI